MCKQRASVARCLLSGAGGRDPSAFTYPICLRSRLFRLFYFTARAAPGAPTSTRLLAGALSAARGFLGSRPATAQAGCALDRRSLGLAGRSIRLGAGRLGGATRRLSLRSLADSLLPRRDLDVRRRGLVWSGSEAHCQPQKVGRRLYAAQRSDTRVAARLLTRSGRFRRGKRSRRSWHHGVAVLV